MNLCKELQPISLFSIFGRSIAHYVPRVLPVMLVTAPLLQGPRHTPPGRGTLVEDRLEGLMTWVSVRKV